MGRRRTSPAAPDLICDNCGQANPAGSTECRSCGRSRWAPEWIQQLRRINRSVSVNITTPHPLSTTNEPVLQLYKWWPGGTQKFNILTAEQWQAIRHIVETDLGPLLGWSSKTDAAKAAKQATKDQRERDAALAALAGNDPKALARLVKALPVDDLPPEELPRLGEAITEIAEIIGGLDASRRDLIRKIVAELPKQAESGLRQLGELMDELTLAQITAVTAEVTRRLGDLALFKERCLDPRTYEIAGAGSIHRLLERAMWIVDERYWLMHSNQQLRTLVTDALAAEDKAFEKKRPDFVCGTVDNKLILIEIKRPAHVLTVKDLNQLERYVVLCEQYHTEHRGFEAILVGQEKSEDLTRTLRLRGGGFKVRTYTDLVSDTERRYKQYLDALDQA